MVAHSIIIPPVSGVRPVGSEVTFPKCHDIAHYIYRIVAHHFDGQRWREVIEPVAKRTAAYRHYPNGKAISHVDRLLGMQTP